MSDVSRGTALLCDIRMGTARTESILTEPFVAFKILEQVGNQNGKINVLN